MKRQAVIEILESHVDQTGLVIIDRARLGYIEVATDLNAGPGDVYSRSVQPVDSGIPLPALATSYTTTDADIERAIAAWDSKEPVYDGLLDATIDDE